MNAKLKYFSLGFVITLTVCLFYSYELKRDFDRQVQDFVEGRGCWKYNVKDGMPPHFHFEFFKPVQPQKPKPTGYRI